MLLLSLGIWALFFRRPVATMPRIFLFRAAVNLIVLLCTFTFWLFYFVQVTEGARALVEGTEVPFRRLLRWHLFVFKQQ